MYRIRTADKGRPLIISHNVIEEYSDCEVDTLHKKNLLALGEDRYLTTLMTKHFPAMSYKFVPDAYAQTAAPETWSVLLSQRRRWINSTIHNLAELVWLKDLCGFCCFSMRFVVFIDLFGTLILPATTVYLGYLIYMVSSGTGQFPLISIIMIASVYGLQAIIFIIKRQWQHVGWMIIYILAFPVYSFVLPIYSFWNQDNFTWGNTRIVIGEKGDKKIVAVQDEGFDPRSIPLLPWNDYARANNLPGVRGNGDGAEKEFYGGYRDEPMGNEMDDMHSVYSSVKPASTILAGFQKGHPYMAPPPQSPAPFSVHNMSQHRLGSMSGMTQFRDAPNSLHGRHMSTLSLGSHAQLRNAAASPALGFGFGADRSRSPFGNMSYNASRPSLGGMPANGSVMNLHSIPSRTPTTIDFRTVVPAGPNDHEIIEAIQAVLAEVDLDNVTKKQVRALVEQRLQSEIPIGERRAFLDKAIDDTLANM